MLNSKIQPCWGDNRSGVGNKDVRGGAKTEVLFYLFLPAADINPVVLFPLINVAKHNLG